jgi:hypothetical protein
MEVVNMAVSSFSLDGIDLSRRPDHLMARYYFHLVNGRERLRDLEGLELTDDLIPEVVTKVVREVQVERPDLTRSQRGWRLEIEDDAGRVIQTIPL